MCRKLTFLVSFVLVLGLAASMAKADITTDLVGYWPFEEGSGTTAADATGNGNDGTLSGGVEWVQGNLGTGVHFDTAGERIVIGPLDPTAANNAMTLAAWINWEGQGHSISQQGIIGKRLGWDPGTTVKWFWQTNPDGDLLFRADNAEGGPGLGWGNGLIAAYSNEWIHVAVTWDNGAAVQYINGEEVETGDITFRDTADDTPVTIGCVDSTNDETFVGSLDEARIYSRALTAGDIVELFEWKGGPPVKAARPSPADGATDVLRDVVLNWKPGESAAPTNGHNVYFSEIFNDVNDGIGGIVQDANSYTPAQRLDFDKTYYWRVDEVNAPPDSTIFKGNVWSFTVEAYSYPIENVTATSISFSEGKGPENTVNGSGLDNSGLLHGNVGDGTMWLSSNEPNGAWIEYEFDNVYKLHEMWVWNSNTEYEWLIGFGLKDVTIEYSADGNDWIELYGVPEFAQALGASDYEHNTIVDFNSAAAKYVRLTANSNWGEGLFDQYGLSEVRFFYVPVQAREPKPASGEADVVLDVVLEWRAGREAASHEVSFSSDRDAVINGTATVDIATENRYEPGPLEFGQIYYWKVNEVNEAASPSSWEGDVWSFSTTEYFVVDDIESYNDLDPDDPESKRIYKTWIDGFDDPTKTNGSVIGYAEPNFLAGGHFVETTIVHGGSQSMPYSYDNNFKYSEAVMTLSAAHNWTQGGATKLSLWFYGDPNNAAERMYFALNGSASVYHDDPAATQKDTWTEWTIDLQEFATQGVDLTNVNTIAIGFGDKNNLQAGGPGKMYFDDIRVGRPIESFGLVAYYPLDEGAGTTITDVSGKGHDGTLTGDGAEWVESQEGYGSALKFPGDVDPNPFVNTGIWNPSERTGELTVAVWVKWEGLNGQYQGIVGKRDSWNATDTYWGLELNVDSGNIGFSRWDNYPWFGDNIPPIGEWQHVAVTFDGTTVIMYIDGVEVGRDTGFSFGAGENAGVVFGVVETSGSNPFNGTIDEVRLYDTALSADEILELAGK